MISDTDLQWFADSVMYPNFLRMQREDLFPTQIPTAPAAFRLLLAIAGQESSLEYRAQLGGGPARGFWQFEQNGAVAGVFTHPVSRQIARRVIDMERIEPSAAAVWRAIEGHDYVATVFARLLLLTDPHPIPTDAAGAWACYLRLWQPGKPRLHDWQDNWRLWDRLKAYPTA